MIRPPEDWPRSTGEHVLVLHPPGGGRITYHERLPVRSVVATARALVAGDARFASAEPESPVRLITEEGEYAGATVLRAGAAVRVVAAVLTDEFVAAVDGAAETAEQAASIDRAVRDLAREASFGLGARRRRPCYTPPPGWSALPNGLVTTWYPPTFPRDRARIVVYPAHPTSDTAADVLDATLAEEERAGFATAGAVEIVKARSDHGLLGVRARLGGEWRREPGRTTRDLTLYVDGRYAYPSWFEAEAGTRGEQLRAAFEALSASMEPLPRPGGRSGQDHAEVSAPWQE